jgi:hypothetical protein
MKKSLLEDATDLGDFARYTEQQPLEDIETKKTEEVPVPEFKLLLIN